MPTGLMVKVLQIMTTPFKGAHSGFSLSMKFEPATIGNGFEVTILDSEALES